MCAFIILDITSERYREDGDFIGQIVQLYPNNLVSLVEQRTDVDIFPITFKPDELEGDVPQALRRVVERGEK